MAKQNAKTDRNDIYQDVTDRIVAALEAGTIPWVRPWTAQGAAAAAMPVNGHSGRPYRGINVLLLWMTAAERGYTDGRWLTFRQAKALGGSVKKGERGTTVVLHKPMEKKDDEGNVVLDEDGKPKRIWMAKRFTLFNAAQCDGLPEAFAPVEAGEESHTLELETCQAFVEATGATIRHGGDRAYYAPAADVIGMPKPEAFASEPHYWATLLHELVHWTGADARCARTFGKRFGDEAYAAEELVAEMGAAFLCAALGVPGELRHADYVGSWLEVLRADKYAVFTAAREAQRAAEYLHRLQPDAAEAAGEADDDTEAA